MRVFLLINPARLVRIFLILLQFGLEAQPSNPPALTFATYAGITVYGLAVDSNGFAYVGGQSTSCASLTKLNQTASAAVWSLCVPGDHVSAVAVDGQGSIYAAATSSLQQTQSLQSTILKLSPNGQQTLYSTSLAGVSVTRLVLDQEGNVYLLGIPDSNFQATAGTFLTTGAAGTSCAIKLDTNGQLQYATFLDLITDLFVGPGSIAVDSVGRLWAVGLACPSDQSPAGTNCNTASVGTASGIRKLDAKGATLLFSTNFGGGNAGEKSLVRLDGALGIAIDPDDSTWVVGETESFDLPTTPTALQPQPGYSHQAVNGDGGIGYAVKFSSVGEVLYGSYIGNNPGDADRAIPAVAVDAQGRPYFAQNINGASAATVMALSADGSRLLSSTSFNSPVYGIALDGNGGLYLAGTTRSIAFFATPNVYQPLYPGGGNAGYVAKFDLAQQAPAVQFSVVVNAASFVAGDNPHAPEGAVAPGEVVTLFGNSFSAKPKVTFDGVTAPILYADSRQINAVVPFAVKAPITVIAVEGARGFVSPVWPAVPALFTADGSGNGQLAALNQDLSVNASSNPAVAGSVVSVFLTGVGALMPPIADGTFGALQPPYSAPVLGVSALVNGANAEILFAGQAPALIAGVIQVNVRIPAATASGNAALVVYVGNYQTQLANTTIAVR
jgi:uncharacterized protein (TIGR03437 family)